MTLDKVTSSERQYKYKAKHIFIAAEVSSLPKGDGGRTVAC